MSEHPLGLPRANFLPKSSPYQIRGGGEECIGVTVAGVDPTLRFPMRHGEHNWMIVLTSPTTSEHLLSGGFAFRPHALADFCAHCWVCERDFTPDVADGPCLGDPRGVDIPTRAEWRAWTDDQKMAWIERISNSRE